MKQTLISCLLFLFIGMANAQDYFPKNDGVKEENNNYVAFSKVIESS